jgi:hypothetical protein
VNWQQKTQLGLKLDLGFVFEILNKKGKGSAGKSIVEIDKILKNLKLNRHVFNENIQYLEIGGADCLNFIEF